MRAGEQRPAGAAYPYTKRQTTDSNEGREAHASCPCLILMAIYEDETLDGWSVLHMLCPSCAAGWVREVAYSDGHSSQVAAGEARSEPLRDVSRE
jgi:hypothetical protein